MNCIPKIHPKNIQIKPAVTNGKGGTTGQMRRKSSVERDRTSDNGVEEAGERCDQRAASREKQRRRNWTSACRGGGCSGYGEFGMAKGGQLLC